MTRRLLGTFLVTVMAACAPAEDAPPPTDEAVTVLTGARLIDGTGAAPIENAIIVIRGERIDLVGAAASVTIPEGAETIDLTGKTIMPPIINLHAHLAQTLGLENTARHFTEENIRDKVNQYAAYGVLHIVSQGHDRPLVYDIRARQRAGDFPGAMIYTAGRGFGVPGGYPPARPEATAEIDAYRITDPDSARAAVRELAANQVDFVKMWVDHQFGTYPEFLPPVYQAIIEEAHAHNIRAGAHIHTLQDAHLLIDAGVDGLLHSVRDQPVDTALIRKFTEGGVFSVSTLVREESMFIFADSANSYVNDPFFTRILTDSVVQVLGSAEYRTQQRASPTFGEWMPALEMAKRNLKTLFDAGVRIGFGSDSGPPGRIEGYFEHREMELMVDAGLTPAQVIEIASRRSAEILGIEQDYGTIEGGKMAEFVILGANPLDDISNTKTLEQVWQRGERIH